MQLPPAIHCGAKKMSLSACLPLQVNSRAASRPQPSAPVNPGRQPPQAGEPPMQARGSPTGQPHMAPPADSGIQRAEPGSPQVRGMAVVTSTNTPERSANSRPGMQGPATSPPPLRRRPPLPPPPEVPAAILAALRGPPGPSHAWRSSGAPSAHEPPSAVMHPALQQAHAWLADIVASRAAAE